MADDQFLLMMRVTFVPFQRSFSLTNFRCIRDNMREAGAQTGREKDYQSAGRG